MRANVHRLTAARQRERCMRLLGGTGNGEALRAPTFKEVPKKREQVVAAAEHRKHGQCDDAPDRAWNTGQEKKQRTRNARIADWLHESFEERQLPEGTSKKEN